MMTKHENKFSGVITALVTPFKDGKVDYTSYKRLLKDQLAQGINGFVVNGTTGESPTLDRYEVKKLFEVTRAEAPHSTVIVGTGSNSTAQAVELSREVSTWSPDALLVVVPYYNRPPQRGLLKHFGAIAQAVSHTPVLLYNVPSRTVAEIEPETVSQVAKENKNVIGIKEASGKMQTLERLMTSSHEFILLSGDDGSCVEFAKNGGHGVISVSSHLIGTEMKKHLLTHTVEEYKTAYSELMKWLYIEPNPIPVKQALFWRGVIDSPELRLPLTALDEKHHKEFQACLKKIGKL